VAKLRIAIGVAAEREDGWRPFAEHELDATSEADWSRTFEPGTIDNIVAEHVWEHMTWTQARTAALLCHRFLRPGGRLRLAVPDNLHASAYVVDAVSATGSKAAEHNHIVDYNHELMRKLLEGCGFAVDPLDWWDRAGVFHSGYSGSDEHGYIIRSYANWPKHPSIYRDPEVYKKIVDSVPASIKDDFISRRIEHTSLIVDGIKLP
jgi:predicted SAM-dependent methyltransferase